MESILRENIFVMTRDLAKDYYWVYKPQCLDGNILLQKMNQTFSKLHKNGIFTSEWYQMKLNGSNNEIIFRIVIDGRKDMYGRLIRRYEGAVINDICPSSIAAIEKSLLKIQRETNNYNYGLEDSLQTEKSDSNKEKKSVENCTIELQNDEIVIKSNILRQFLQEHTYTDLIATLKIEPNDLEEQYTRHY